MHYKRKQAKKILLIIGAVALILLISSITVLFLSSDLLLTANNGEYELPESNIKGLTLSTGTASMFASVQGTEAQMQFIDEFVDFAQKGSFNSVFVEYMHVSPEGTASVFGRESKNETMANITENDELFDKFDAMEYLVNSAAGKGLYVYAMYNMPAADDESTTKSAQNTMSKYAVSGVFYKNEVTEGIGTLVSSQGDSVSYTSQQIWAQPQELFLHTISPNYTGMVLDNYDTALMFSEEYALMVSAIQNEGGAPTLLGYSVPPTLSIEYPKDTDYIGTSTCWVMGTSDPTLPLTMDGEEIARISTTGAFGVLVELEYGDNSFVFEQNGNTLVYTIDRGGSTGSSSGTSSGTSSSSDGTSSVSSGSYIAVDGWIESLLYDPDSDGNINETVRSGGTAMVVDSVRTYRSGKSTWAYELSSGDYILAYNTKYLGTSLPVPTFTGATAQAIDNGKGELLTFTGTGTPIAYTTIIDSTLSVKIYDADIAADFAVQGSEMVVSTSVLEMEDGGTEILFTFAQPLYGHSIEYADGTTQLYLKKAPQISTENPAQPLVGVSVLLDAGHGAEDTGALGVAGLNGPSEKDANLAVAEAAKYRLEQLGATVHMMRTDDTFFSLEERNMKITELRPDFFISLHHNSVQLTVDVNEVSGVECYYFYNESQSLSETLVSELVDATGRAERGSHWGYYYVARNPMCPAVLLECGFMVNPKEYEDIVNEQELWAVGDAIARSVLHEVSEN